MSKILNFSGDYTGLSNSEAATNLELYGYNTESKLSNEHGKIFNPLKIFISPRFFIMLIAAALMLCKSTTLVGGIVMLVLIVLYCSLEIYKGVKFEQGFIDLSKTTSLKYRVVRNGEIILISKEYMVPDDIIILQGGENIPADAVLLEVEGVSVDESLFSGHKIPVIKITGYDDNEGDVKRNMIYKGTKVLTGSLVAKIKSTGVDTLRHKTFKERSGKELYYTSFEQAVRKVMPYLNIISMVLLFTAALFSFLPAEIKPEDNLLNVVSQIALPAIAFALCFIPTETSSLIRLYYLFGATKLANKNAVIKSLKVIEQLNAITCICVDKTGTITKSKIEVAGEYTKDKELLNNVAVLACSVVPTSGIDQAIVLNATFKGIDVKELRQGNNLIMEYPFDENTKLAGNLWSLEEGNLMCVKGSPENVISFCDINPEILYKVQKKQAYYSSIGYQVLAVACAPLPDKMVPNNIFENRLTFVGLIAFTNQTKDTVPLAVKNCYKSGVNVIMTTGDNSDTAVAIAKKIGLKDGSVITGEQLRDAARDGEKISLKGVNIFARITPEQKLEIVKMLQEEGEIVAVTSDSTTNSEIFETADVSIAMAQNASGSVYEAAKLLMNDDNLNAIVDTIKESRQTHQNVKRCIKTVLSAHIALAVFVITNLCLGIELMFTPVMVALFTVLIIPVAALIYLNNRSDIKLDLTSSGFIGRGIMDKKFFVMPIIQGAVLGAVCVLMFLFYGNAAESRSIFFAMFVSGLITMCWENISGKRSLFSVLKEPKGYPALISGILLAITLILIYVPFVNEAFGFKFLDPVILLISILLGIVSAVWTELLKLKKN